MTKKLSILILSAIAALLCSCAQEESQPVKYSEPEVNFPMTSETINTVVGESVEFVAEVVSGDKVSVAWYVADVLESSAQKFIYTFDTPGTFKVRFEARNGAGTVEREYTVNVTDDFKVRLSVGDSTRITRLQLSTLNVAAIVDKGSDIEHRWTVDGVVACTEAFFGSLVLTEAKDYSIEYYGANAAGSFSHSFVVESKERPLEMSYSVTDRVISLIAGKYFSVSATPVYGGTGLQQEWTLDGTVISTESSINHYFGAAGAFKLEYNATNARGETAYRQWMISVTQSGYIFDDFEGISALSEHSWWTLGQNQPGIELVENPLKAGINTSDYCIRDKVNGETGTSGYFDLSIAKWATDNPNFEFSKYSKLRFKVYLNGNNYYPMVQLNGATQISPMENASNAASWVVLMYDFGTAFSKDTKFTIRAMRTASGGGISGYDEATNNRIVYFDDFEFVE